MPKLKDCLLTVMLVLPGMSMAQMQASPSPEIKSLVTKLLERNDAIRVKQILATTAAAEVDRAQGKYQPILGLSAGRSRQKEPNTAEEALTRIGSVYEKRASDYSTSISKLFATGAQIEAKASMTRFMTSTIEAIEPQPDNVRSYYGLSLTQPLMRDAGVEVTEASVTWAKLDADAALTDVDDVQNTAVAQGLLVFYDLQAAQKREQIANEKVAMASRLLALAKKAKQAERVSDAEVWDVESSLNRFKVAALEASQSRVEQSGKLQTLLMQDASEVHPMWPDALPEKALDAADSKELLDKALTHRGDYRRLQLMLQRAESQLRYMDNQRKPRVDLNLSYGRNGLAFESQKAFALDATKDTPSWSVVLNIQMPLGTNVQGQAGYAQARARVEEARLTLQALEVSIRNDIASSVRLVESVKQRWGHWSAVADRETNQLVLERKRLENGRSDMRELLFKEERSMNARMSVVEQQASYAKALVLQKAAAGSVISDYLVE